MHSTIYVYAFAHFLVDFSCAYLVFHTLNKDAHWWLSILLYNFCAFALQMPLGLIADKKNKNSLIAILGCTFVCIACLPILPFLLIAILAGVGNAMFHIGGGLEVINESHGKATPLGIFVSPGTLGIFLGTLLGDKKSIPIIFQIAILLCLVAFLILHNFKRRDSFQTENQPLSMRSVLEEHRESNHYVFYVTVMMIGLVFVVSLRSYLGLALTFSWKSKMIYKVLLILAVVLGKAFGGIASDFFGERRTIVLSLSLAAICFLFANYPIFGILAIFLFNMTMPITLHRILQVFPGAGGFAFGILTFALFLGYLPFYLIKIPLIQLEIASLISMVSMVVLYFLWKGDAHVD